MLSVLGFILSFIFLILAGIHFNWARGGQWALDNALPQTIEGKRLFTPRKIDSAIVGLGLLLFASFYGIKSGLINFDLPSWIINYAGWIISSIFLLRAIGDFKYVGFFKKIKNTKFGEMDTKIYSPLCLFLAIVGYLVELF